MANTFENHRMRWSNTENNQLYKEINKGLDLETIALNHKRTVEAIKYKLIRYAIELAEEDQTLTLANLCNITTLKRDDLIEGFKKLKYDYINLTEIDINNTYVSYNEIDDSESDDSSDKESDINNTYVSYNEIDNSDEELLTVITKINTKINIITGVVAFYTIVKLGIYGYFIAKAYK